MNAFMTTNLDLKYYTTIHIGGTVEWAFTPVNRESLPEIFSIIQNKLKVEFFVLGRGSNVIIKDGLLHMAAILTHKLDQYHVEDDTVIVDAGVAMSFLAKDVLVNYQLSGLEFLYGLPGSIGGGVFMNARVYGSEFKDFVEWVEVYDYEKNEFLIIEKEECNFTYKNSIFQKSPYFITRTALKLSKTDNVEECLKVCQQNRDVRIEKLQFKYPSAGSFFKNSYELGKSSGKILEELDLKGYTKGGAQVSEFHANFFINPEGKATYDDMKDLMNSVEEKLWGKNGFHLEPEVLFIPKESSK